MNSKQVIGLLGCVIAFAGCFFPIFHITRAGDITAVLHDGELAEGAFIVVTSILGILAAIKQSQGFLSALAIIGGGILLDIWMRTSEIAAAAGLAISSRIGTPMILIGLILMFVAAFLPQPATQAAGSVPSDPSSAKPDWIQTSIWLGFAVGVISIILMN